MDTPATCEIRAVIRLLHAKNASAVEISRELSRDNAVGIAAGYELDDRGVGV
jgi:sulfopyruvate decarboxylase TPP-binding subunit